MVAGIVLGALGTSAGGFGGVVLGTVGGIVGSQLDQLVLPLIFKSPGRRVNSGDIDITLATEGTAGTLVWGQYARVPMHLVWASHPWDEAILGRIGKRREVVGVSRLSHAQWIVAMAPLFGTDSPSQGIQQIIMDGRRVYLRDTVNAQVSTTARLRPATLAGVEGYAMKENTTTYRWIRIETARDAGGIPITGSPDLSVYDTGGKAAIAIGGLYANGTSSKLVSDEWEVAQVSSDSNGNSRLDLRMPQGFSFPPAHWSAFFETPFPMPSHMGWNMDQRIIDGTSVVLDVISVGVDRKVFPTHDPQFERGYNKSDIMVAQLADANVAYLREVEQVSVEAFNQASFGNRFPNAIAIVDGLMTGLETVVDDIVDTYTDLDSSDIDVDRLGVLDIVQGLWVSTPFVPEAPLTALQIVHDLVWQEGRGSGRGSLARLMHGHQRDNYTLDETTLNAVRPGEEFDDEDVRRNRIDAKDRPKRVEVVFRDVDDALQQGSEDERLDGFDAGEEVRIDLSTAEVSCALDRDTAKAIARRLMRESHDRMRAVEITTTIHNALVQEDDYLELTDHDGRYWLILVEEITVTPDFFVTIRGHATSGAASGAPESGGAGTLGSGRQTNTGEGQPALNHAPLDWGVEDLPPLREEDVGRPGFYAWATPHDPGILFGGAGIFIKRPGSDTWTGVGVVKDRATYGFASTALATGSTSGYDVTNDFNIQLVNGELESVLDDDVDVGRNLFLLGDEVVGVVDWTQEADGSYTASTLSRGRLATAAEVGGHVDGERCLALDDALVFVPLTAEDVGTTIDVRIVPPGRAVADVESVSFVVSGSTVKPLPVASLTVTDNLDNTLTVTWARQALRTARFRAPAGQPAEAGDRVVLEFYNEALPNPVTLLHTEIVDGNVTSLTLDNPGSLGLTGPTVSCIATVRSLTWGDSATSGSGVDGTFDPSGATNPTVGELADVDLTGLTDGDVLVYDEITETWVPGAGGGGAPDSLNDIGDVDLTGLEDGDGIVYDQGTLTWKPGRPAGAPDWMPRLATYRDWASAGLAGFTSTVLGSGSVYLTDTQNYAPDRVANVTSSVTVDGSSAVAGTNAAMLEADDVLGYAVAGRKFRVRLRVTSSGATESMRVGWMGAHTSPAANARPVSGFWIEFDRSIDATNILLVCGDGTTQSHTATSKTFASLGGTWTTFEIEFETTSSVKLYSVSAGVRTLLATHTTNVPSTDTARALRWLQQVTKYNLFGSAAPRIACEFPSYDVDLSGKEVVLP